MTERVGEGRRLSLVEHLHQTERTTIARLAFLGHRFRAFLSPQPRYVCLKHNRGFLERLDADFHQMLAPGPCEWQVRATPQ